MIKLKFYAFDSWDRAVYTDEAGRFWKTSAPVNAQLALDADHIKAMGLYDSNDFDGEPGWPMKMTIEIVIEK